MSFKVGDRVVVYSASGRSLATIQQIVDISRLVTVRLNKPIRIAGVEHITIPVHPKQCRKLVKKDILHVWIDTFHLATLIDPALTLGIDTYVSMRPRDGWTEFKEVRSKKK